MTKKDVKTVKDLEKYYSQARKIKFGLISGNEFKPKTVRDVKRLLFEQSPQTTYSRGGHHSYANRYRSFDDYFLLCKNYFPKLTVKRFAEVLLKDEQLKGRNGNKVINIRYCPNIRKDNSGGLGIWAYCGFHNTPNRKLELGFKKEYSLMDIIN
tara:strand:- start:1274 stop:1735 length:462 start_codon:yes stop_codon:yes gene_type:complete